MFFTQGTGFAHNFSDNPQLRYQRNLSLASNINILEMGQYVWYQPLTLLAQPLNIPSSQFSNLDYGLRSRFPAGSVGQLAHSSPMVSGPTPNHIGHIIPTSASCSLFPNADSAVACLYNINSQPALICEQNKNSNTQEYACDNGLKKEVPMDEDTSIHGNWSKKNAKLRLLCFCEANRYPLAYIHVEDCHNKKLRNRSWAHRCRKTLDLSNLYKIGKGEEVYERRKVSQFLHHIGKIITGDGKGQTRKEASEKCALSLIRHLYQLELIETNLAPVKLKKKKEFQVESCNITISQELAEELDRVLNLLKIKATTMDQHEAQGNTGYLFKSPRLSVTEVEEIMSFKQYILPQWHLPCEKWDPWLNCRITEGPLSEMSMKQIGIDLRNSRYQQIEDEHVAQQMLTERLKLPIFNCISDIMNAVQTSSVVIIQGPNGCGKSTQVPQYILDTYINAGRGGECSIIVIQPRRLTAVSISQRISQERGETMGTACGYSIRFDSQLPRPFGSILFCTGDVLLKKLKSGLRGISHIIVDEIQERDHTVDVILLVLREMAKSYSNIKIILLSGPTNVTLFSDYFSNCPIVEVPTGQLHLVQEFYLEDCIEMTNFVPNVKKNHKQESEDDNSENMNKVVGKNYLKTTAEAMAAMSEEEISFELIEALLTYISFLKIPGAILIFLPGWNAVCELKNHLQQHLTFGSNAYLILPLHSQITHQDTRLFEAPPPGVTKVILSSRIGEAGITINDVVYIIDSCKVKLRRFNSHELLFNSAIVWASKRNLEQRKGRAGRTQSGKCFRLCSRARFERLNDDMPGAITYTPLDELALAIKFLHLGNIHWFFSQTLQPPPLYLVLQAETLLRAIGALDKNGELTSLGTILGQLPLRPQLGRMVVLSCLFQLGDPFCTITPRTGIFTELFDTSTFQQSRYARQHFQRNQCSDFVTLANAFAHWEKATAFGKHAGKYFCEEFCLSEPAMEITKNARRQLKAILQAIGFPLQCMSGQECNAVDCEENLDMISALLLVGYHPNVCYYNVQTKKFIANGSLVDIDSSSVYTFADNLKQFSRREFFVFEELINLRPHCAEMTIVTPLQLLLFGHSHVEFANGIVVLDNWIKLKMDLQLASNLLSLRKHLDSVLIEVASDPSLINSDNVHQLVSLIKALCSKNAISY